MGFQLKGTPMKVRAVAANMDSVLPIKSTVVQVKPKEAPKKAKK